MADTCCIRVVCRVRPLNSKEKSSGSKFVVSFPGEASVALGNKNFNFDRVFKPDSSQSEVYQLTAFPLVKDVLCGYNATIFAYGQTSSGKTHTMEGELVDPDLQGITPRIVNEIFEQIYSMDTNLEFQIKVSYFELYMERVRDLLDVSKVNLPIHENKKKVPYVKGVTERFVTTPDEVMAVIEDGKNNRHVSVTNMNAHSSRSHAIFLISIRQENKETHHTLTGKLFLVDLAGSEKVEKTNAQGLTLEEAKAINKSLLALSNVISSLSEGTRSHIPYRDSKLTRVLQESLGGNARTTLIVCCSPSSYNESESKSTLLFGERAKMIKNKVEVNVELTAEEWRKRYEKLKDERDSLKQLVSMYVTELTRWRKGETVPASEQTNLKSVKASPTKGSKVSSNASSDVSPSRSMGGDSEEEHVRLYQQLEDKDEDMHKQIRMTEELNSKLKDMEETMAASKQDSAILNEKLMEAEHEIARSHEEVQEVMQALEELALSYDGKDTVIEGLQNEVQALTSEIDTLQAEISSRDEDVQSLNDMLTYERKKNKNSLMLLFKELNEMGNVLGSKSDDILQVFESNADLTEEDFTRARIQLSNMRIEARSVTEQRNILEQAERTAKSEAESAMREVNALRMKISQMETQADNLQISLKTVSSQKKDVESALEELHEQMLSLRDKECELTAAAEHQRRQERTQQSLEEALVKHQETHQRELEALKSEITNKGYLITQLQEQYQRQQLMEENLRNEIAQLELQQQEYSLLSQRLSIKEKIEQEYNGVTETVKSELTQLDSLKQVLYKKILNRMQPKVSESAEKGEVKFIEKNLEELSRVHKKTLASLSDLQREVPKYQSQLEAKTERIKQLEALLRETKEAADREYHRLHQEKEQMKNAFIEKLKERERSYYYRKQGPSIVRPVVRPRGAESVGVVQAGSSSRDALLAVAGVQRVSQTKRSPLLSDEESLQSHTHSSRPQTSSS